MGQYNVIVNLDKRVFIDPSAFGDHFKLRKFGTSASGAMSALALLLARHNVRASGDVYSTQTAVGSWADDGDLLSLSDEERGAFADELLTRIGPGAPLYERSHRHPGGVRERLRACARDRTAARAA